MSFITHCLKCDSVFTTWIMYPAFPGLCPVCIVKVRQTSPNQFEHDEEVRIKETSETITVKYIHIKYNRETDTVQYIYFTDGAEEFSFKHATPYTEDQLEKIS